MPAATPTTSAPRRCRLLHPARLPDRQPALDGGGQGGRRLPDRFRRRQEGPDRQLLSRRRQSSRLPRWRRRSALGAGGAAHERAANDQVGNPARTPRTTSPTPTASAAGSSTRASAEMHYPLPLPPDLGVSGRAFMPMRAACRACAPASRAHEQRGSVSASPMIGRQADAARERRSRRVVEEPVRTDQRRSGCAAEEADG